MEDQEPNTHKNNPKPSLRQTIFKYIRRQKLILFVLLFALLGFQVVESTPTSSFSRLLQCNVSQKLDPKNEVPKDFAYQDYRQVIKIALKSYINPKRSDYKRIYFASANAALQSLPYSLSLMTKKFYENRATFINKSDLIPGKALSINANDPYIIFIPNYKLLNEREKTKANANRSLSIKERRNKAAEIRRERQKIKRYNDKTITKILFTEKNFKSIISWIEENGERFLQNPNSDQEKKGKNDANNTLTMNTVYFAAANGALQTLDPHSAIIPKNTWQKALASAEDSSFEGIGALLRGGGQSKVVIETPLPGSPALKSGIRAGDVIIKVDNKDIQDLSLDQVVQKIRGPKNTIVKLEIERELELKRLVIAIKRNVIEQKSVTSKLLTAATFGEKIIPKKSSVAYIKINSFLFAKKNTSRLVADEYRKISATHDPKYLILDLRNNPGGYLEEAVSVADLFLPSGKTVVEIRGRKKSNVLRTSNPPVIPKKINILVLINANSASASEILASAFIDYDRAIIAGDRSFGKATVQGIQPLNKTILKLTTARYYAPNGYTVQVFGVQPDIKISDEVDGSFPASFREEDMWDHLPSVNKAEVNNTRKKYVNKIVQRVGNNKVAEAYIQKHKNDAIRVDAMLIRSLAYLLQSNCCR